MYVRIAFVALCSSAVACGTNEVATKVMSCTDGVRNGSEADLDCGGSCGACALGNACREHKDCASTYCGERKCQAVPTPRVSGLEPWSGPVAGGTAVTVSGTGFVTGMKVGFGAAQATDVVVASPTELTAKTPGGAAGPVDVTVSPPVGVEVVLPGGFVYAAEGSGPMAVGAVLPGSGGTAGGTRGLVTGQGFVAGAKLYFGGVAATATTVLDASRIVFTTPAGRAGRVDVLVMNPVSGVAHKAQAFDYVAVTKPAPTLAGVFPARVAVGSAEPLEARGTDLGQGALVFVGDEPAVEQTAADASVTFVLPPGLAPGKYTVTVTTADGRTVTLADALEVLAPACDDGVRNGKESDVDCGGGCAACGDRKKCGEAKDCSSRVCLGGVCLAPACEDGVKNGDETDVDCGGGCEACADLETCAVAKDCRSKVCAGSVCQVPACNDGGTNGLESDTDCGGGCPACADGLVCVVPADCLSKVCRGGTCTAPTCDDVEHNGRESDVDCGGPTCRHCAAGGSCREGADCASGVCDAGVCSPPTCTDRVKNGGEADVDCGGGCAACGVGRGCANGGDCVSLVCTGGVCAAPGCHDGAKNGGETDVDCGGGCDPCSASQHCAVARDCGSGVCTGALCRAPSCLDGMKNGSETDTDCGGTCRGCSTGARCAVGADCGSLVCTGGLCQAASCLDRVKNGLETDVDCGSIFCATCADTKTCDVAADCASGVCAVVCQVASCTDNARNGSETDVDCGGGCAKCAESKACSVDGDCVSGACRGGVCVAATCTSNAGCTGGLACIASMCQACRNDVDCATLSCVAGKCGMPKASCKDILSSGVGHGNDAYNIQPVPTVAPVRTYCDMTTDGGGWTLVAYGLTPSLAVPAKYKDVGTFVFPSTVGVPYTQARLQCQSDAPTNMVVDRIRSMSESHTNLDDFGPQATGETYDPTDNAGRPSQTGYFHDYAEWHGFNGMGVRYIVRTNQPHCALAYESVGTSGALGLWGQIWVR